METRRSRLTTCPTWIPDADPGTAAMEDASRGNPDHTERELTQLQKDIYEFLKKKKLQKPLAIAKAIGKSCAKDVNPDLYKMRTLKLLDCNEDKLWSVKAVSSSPENQAENNAEIEHSKKHGATSTCPLTDKQREIFTLLEENRPMKAKDIAKRVGKRRATDVNRDLYAMEEMDLLTHSDTLWRVKNQNDKTCTTCNEEFDVPRRSSRTVLSDNNCTSLNQTYVEHQDNQPCNNTQCNNDSGTASVDHTITGGPRVTQPPTDGTIVPYSYNAMIQTPMVHNSYIYIYNSQVSSIGRNCRVHCEYGQHSGFVAGESSAPADASAAQDGLQQTWQPEWSDGTQTEYGPLDVSNISATEEIQGRPLQPSAPTAVDQFLQDSNISAISYGIEKVNLGKQDDLLS